jgi:hypothetical protein
MKDLRLVEVSSVHTSGLGQIHYFPKCFLVSEIGVLCRVSKIYPSLPLLVRVVGAYVHFLFIHPFVDQNGRAARKLLTGVLSNAVADQNAEVPVGFLVSLDRPRHNNIIHEFAATGDWDGLMRYFCLLFRAAGQIRLREMRRRRDDGVRGRL